MRQSDAPLALLLTQSDIPPDICAHLMLLLHQTLACTIELRSSVEQISCHVKGTDVTPCPPRCVHRPDDRTPRRALQGSGAPSRVRVLMPAAAGSVAHVAEAVRGRLLLIPYSRTAVSPSSLKARRAHG